MLFTTLRSRLIAVCVTTVMFAMLSLIATNYLTTKSRMVDTLDKQMRQLSESDSATIAEWISSRKSVVSSIKQAIAFPDPSSAVKAARTAGGFDDAYIGYADKRAVFSQQRPLALGYDPTKRPWYIKASQSPGPVVTSPYASASTGKLLVTFAEAATGAGGAVSAVAAADVLLDTVIHTVIEIKPTSNSYAFLVDSAGKVIAHPNASLTLKPISDLDGALSATSLAGIEASHHSKMARLDGRERLLQVAKVAGTDWMLVIVLDLSDAMLPLTAMLTSSALIALVLVLVASLLLSVLIAKSLKGLGLVRDALQEIATGDGDLTRRLDASGADELGQIAKAFNRFVDKIALVLLDIRTASETIKAASREIAEGNSNLSSRTETQAASLEETASAMEELTSGVNQNAGNAEQANQLALSASNVAFQAGAMVNEIINVMGAINTSSKKVADIISVIDGIAFQTNILALNAAVESARAGEQGRGFAVVASEVRNLAQRSATAAKEIKLLIVESVGQVEQGSQLVEQAGATMTNVVTNVQRVSDVIAEITVASQEQSRGINETNQAISQMDETTQQNAALVEEAAAGAQSLQDQANHLAKVVSSFKLE
ncbi:chemotaxis protein [Burkholderia sp. Leaf177]|uniref:methyl-accepting chemotaxis protein n=1 Tax=Burkholderia sp. Leaf177 TaxID=1736287 RepID=UPI0006FEE037|nr:methyl-accepting chemotaxis protein [Burkholderia sp. Leaf177]KQR77109.1 chemotaxis protein [Burkholderia sp. Leaf177]